MTPTPTQHIIAAVASTIYNIIDTPIYIAGIASYNLLKGLTKIPSRMVKAYDFNTTEDTFIATASFLPPIGWGLLAAYGICKSVIFPAINAAFDTIKYQLGIIEKLFVGLNEDLPGTEVTNTKINLDFFLGRDTGYGRDAGRQIVNELNEQRKEQNAEKQGASR